MSLSSKANKDIQFLHDLDPKQYSIGREGDSFKTVNKRSLFWNLFWGIIHFITVGFVARNRELDRITSEILEEIGDELSNATISERDLVEKGIRNLHEVIQNNEEGAKAKQSIKCSTPLPKFGLCPMSRNYTVQNRKQFHAKVLNPLKSSLLPHQARQSLKNRRPLLLHQR